MKNAEDILNNKIQDYKICVSPDHTILQAIDIMNKANVGAVLVESGDDIAGIWTERDLLRSIGRAGFDPKTARIGDHMQTRLHWAAHDTTLMQLQEMFLGLFIRHIIVKKQGRFIGLLSIGDILRAILLEKEKELKKLNKIASWQYYENWGWDRKKRKGN
jgi:CBS domain-containing protein